jgi:hypothetical protein
MKSILIIALICVISCRHHTKKSQAFPKVLSGDICDMEAREYMTLKKCGCKYHGKECSDYHAYVHEEPADDKTKWKAGDFKAINTDLTKEEETKIESKKTEIEAIDDFIMFDKGEIATCLLVCKGLSLHKNLKEA